ncbi:MAG: metallophosphoesterase family protein [Acidimicrobiales bacterium]
MSPQKMTREVARTLSIAEQHDWFQKQRSRRALLKGGLATTGALIAAPALLNGADGAALTVVKSSSRLAPFNTFVRNSTKNANWYNGTTVTPFGGHVSFGPNPTSTINLAWQVAAQVNNPFVRIGTNPFDLGEAIPAETRVLSTPWADITDFLDSVPPAQSAAKAPEVQYYLHAAVTNLRPDTTYYYTVGHQGWDAPWQAPGFSGSFTTAPNFPQPFTFTAFGDHGTTYDAVGTANLILAQNPAFHLHAGDVSYAEDGGDGLLTDPYDPRAWDSYFAQIGSVASQLPWMISLGNHEMEPWYSPNGYGGDVDRIDFPGNGPSVCPGTYSFTYGNVAFVSLDPNDVSYEIPANLGYSHGQQTAWLGSTLSALRSDPSVNFIVVFFHHCAYSTCTTHGCEGGVQQFWTPLFDQYNVDLVINGHNHVYERTDPIIGGSPTTSAPIGTTVTPATQGTTYITAGGAGKSLYAFSAPDSYEGNIDKIASVSTYVNEAGGTTDNETVTWSQVRYTGYCLLVGEVTPARPGGTTTLVVRGLNEYGVEVDRITLSRQVQQGRNVWR